MNTQPTRDIPSAVMAAIFAVLLLALATWMFTIGTWWTITIGVLALLPLPVLGYGIAESLQPAIRDNKGKRIQP